MDIAAASALRRSQIADNRLDAWSTLVPVAGCRIIGLMARFGSEKIRGHGIPEAMEAILIGRRRIQRQIALLKPLSSAISFGTDGPFGAEGPIIMTGGAFGLLFAQFFHLSNAERKTLLVTEAAAGMAATFGTPVAAMRAGCGISAFRVEAAQLRAGLGRQPCCSHLSSLAAGGRHSLPNGHQPTLPSFVLVLAAGLGVLCGLASGLLTQMVYACEDIFQRLPIHWMWWPLIGGLAIGLGGLVEPHALGVGYDNIAALLHGEMTTDAMLRLVIVKAVIWSIALGSGTSRGVLAPLLIMGGALGALFGGFLPAGDTGLWALVGMAAMMGGTMRSPITAIIFAIGTYR